MSETATYNPDLENKRVHDVEKAHSLAIEGDGLETQKVPYVLAKRAIETAYITGEAPIDVARRVVARDRVYDKDELQLGRYVSETPKDGSPRANMQDAHDLIEYMIDKYVPVKPMSAASRPLTFDEMGYSETLDNIDEKLVAIYEKKPVTEDQKDRARSLGHDPENMHLL